MTDPIDKLTGEAEMDRYPDLPPISTAQRLEIEALHPSLFLLTPPQLQAANAVSSAIGSLVAEHFAHYSPDERSELVHRACLAVRDTLNAALHPAAEQGT